MPGNVLAIDQGGHATRALIYDPEGRVVAQAMRPVGEIRPLPDRVEQNPEELVSSVRQAVKEAVSRLGGRGEIVAAGMATQRSSIVCWDRRNGKALSSVLSWQDRRAAAWLAGLSSYADEVRRRTGLLLSPHYGASKLRWCLDELPRLEVARRAGYLACGPLASFLLFRLLRECPLVTDPANGSRTLLMSLEERDWDPVLLEIFGLPRQVLPDCVATRHPFGTLDLPKQQVSLRILHGDQAAALFAWGRPAAEAVFVNLGTGAFLQRISPQGPVLLPGLLAGVAAQEDRSVTYTIEASVNGAGSALRLVGEELGVEDVDSRLPAWLQEVAEPPLFLNGVSGLGSPFWVPDFDSRFMGEGKPREKLVAVAESIVFLLCLNLRVVRQVPPELQRIIATGGLARQGGLCQRLADLAALPVERPAEHEATARGAAFLAAGSPSGWLGSEAIDRFEPRDNPDLVQRFQRWEKALQEALPGRPAV